MIQQELQLFPDPTIAGYEFRRGPDDESKHARKASVTNDNEKGAYEERDNGCIEGLHRVRREGETNIIEH